MKIFKPGVIGFIIIMASMACQDTNKTQIQNADKQNDSTSVHSKPLILDENGREPARSPRGAWHFICPKGCSGGAGAEVNCTKCGTKLIHNAAYHL